MATKAELQKTLKDAGIGFNPNANKDELEKLIKENLNQDEPEDQNENQNDGEGAEDDGEVKTTTETNSLKAMKKKIEKGGMTTIKLQRIKDGIKTEVVIINGVRFEIPRGKSVEVPKVVADVLFAKFDAEAGEHDNKLDETPEELN